MEIQASRSGARIGVGGQPVLLLDQDRARWDQLLIRRGQAAIAACNAYRPRAPPRASARSSAACHARARTPEETNWARIVVLYEVLAEVEPSPIVELNRAVAVSMAFGAAEGLAMVDELGSSPALQGYHLLPSVRGDLLAKLGRLDEARGEFQRAAALTSNARERELLLERAASCVASSSAPSSEGQR
jgi:predicted RNA polymerase sigma factor